MEADLSGAVLKTKPCVSGADLGVSMLGSRHPWLLTSQREKRTHDGLWRLFLSELCPECPWGCRAPLFSPSLSLSSPSSARFSALRLHGGSEMRYPAPCAAWPVSFMHACIHSFIHTEGRVLFQIREHQGQHYLLVMPGPICLFVYACLLLYFYF